MNLYNVYFVSKGTGPRTVQIEAQNSAGVKPQVEARYPGAYNIIISQVRKGLQQRLKRVSRITTLDAGVPGRTDGQQLLPAKAQ
jgi:hypothetical protein